MDKNKLFLLNFWNRNRSLKVLLFVLGVAVMALLHICGIIVMVRSAY